MPAAPRVVAQRLLQALAQAQCGGPGLAAAAAAATTAPPAAASSSARAIATAAAAATAARCSPPHHHLNLLLPPLAARSLFPAARIATNANRRAAATAASSSRGGSGLHTSSAAAAAAAEAAEQQQQSNKPTPWGQRSPLSFNSMVAGLAVFLGIVAVAQGTADKRVGDMMKKSQQVAGKAAVGGPFKLTDTRGKAFTNRDLLGEFCLLYFGFTHCPDICPDELEKVAEAVDDVERTTGAKVVPVFISVDPKRDTPQRVAAYVREFHPRMVGLTGSEQAVTDAAKAYRVYFSRTDGGGGGSGSGGGGTGVTNPSPQGGASDDDYLVDHSIITYLVDPAGEFVTFYGKNFDAAQLAESIAGHVMAWGEKDEGYLSRLACALPGAAAEGQKEGGGDGKKEANK